MILAGTASASTLAPLTWGERFVMLSGGVMAALALIGITAVLPQIEADLARTEIDKLLIKLLMTIVGLTMVIGAPVTGYLIDRLGLKKVLLASCVLYTVAGTAGLYLNSLHALFASRLLLGLAAAGMPIMSMTLINRRFDGVARAKWMGAHISVAMGATIVLHPLIGFVGEFGWRGPFGFYAIGLLIAAAAAFGLIDEKPSRSSSAGAEKKGDLLRCFPFRFAGLAVLIGTITYVPMVYIPFVIRELGIASPTVISTVFLADSIIGAVVAAYFGWSQRHLSSNATFVISFGTTGVGLLIAATASSFAMVFAGMMIFGFGIGWFVPNLMTAASKDIATHLQGRALGLVKSGHYAAAPLGVVLVEPISRLLGPQGGILATAILALLLAAGFAASLYWSGAKPHPASDPVV